MKRTILIPLLLSTLIFSSNGLAECIEGNCTNGTGRMTYDGGDQYIGTWKNGQRHGYGVFTMSDGNQYKGEWKNDVPHGKGTLITQSGENPEAIWEDGNYRGTVSEVEEKRKAEEERRKVQEAKYQKMMDEAEEERKRWDKIYNACLLDKGADVDMTSTTMAKAVRSTCKGIADNPSFLESWKYE